MKKYFLLFALILIFSVSACGKKSENQAIPGQNDDDETAETADNEQNDSDTEIPVYQDSDLPECSPESATPCKDSSSGLIWSSKYSEESPFSYFSNTIEISEGGFTDWREPTISQLRTLIQNCPVNETGGACELYDNCRDENICGEHCDKCEESDSGKYSKFGDTGMFWTISTTNDRHYAYSINFDNAAFVLYCDLFYDWFVGTDMGMSTCGVLNVRFTRCIEHGYMWDGKKCVENPCNSDPCKEIPHTLGCWAEREEEYYCFCDEGYFWYEAEQVCAETPCKDDTCIGVPNALDYCFPITPETYRCNCQLNYSWNGKECVPD